MATGSTVWYGIELRVHWSAHREKMTSHGDLTLRTSNGENQNTSVKNLFLFLQSQG